MFRVLVIGEGRAAGHVDGFGHRTHGKGFILLAENDQGKLNHPFKPNCRLACLAKGTIQFSKGLRPFLIFRDEIKSYLNVHIMQNHIAI